MKSSVAPIAVARASAYLLPGQLLASAAPTAITTVLGSCVSICLWDPVAKVGGMNHFILPLAPPNEPASWRYGEHAISELIAKVTALGAHPAQLNAQVYGGAHVLRDLSATFDLGARNVHLALRSLQVAGIPVRHQSVGGTRGRKCVFHTDDGATWLKEL